MVFTNHRVNLDMVDLLLIDYICSFPMNFTVQSLSWEHDEDYYDNNGRTTCSYGVMYNMPHHLLKTSDLIDRLTRLTNNSIIKQIDRNGMMVFAPTDGAIAIWEKSFEINWDKYTGYGYTDDDKGVPCIVISATTKDHLTCMIDFAVKWREIIQDTIKITEERSYFIGGKLVDSFYTAIAHQDENDFKSLNKEIVWFEFSCLTFWRRRWGKYYKDGILTKEEYFNRHFGRQCP